MQRTKEAAEVLKCLIEYIDINLVELTSDENGYHNDFACGATYAYVECLEFIQAFWEDCESYGLRGNLEQIYKIK